MKDVNAMTKVGKYACISIMFPKTGSLHDLDTPPLLSYARTRTSADNGVLVGLATPAVSPSHDGMFWKG